jgi:hypothetical protein
MRGRPTILRTTPSTAIAHTSPKSVQPTVPRSTPSANGVSVPAIITKIAA